VGDLIPIAYQRLAKEEIRCHNYLPIRMGSTSFTCRPSRMRCWEQRGQRGVEGHAVPRLRV